MNEPEIIAELRVRAFLGSNRYILLRDRLVHEWDYKTGNKGKVHYQLSSLSPDIYSQRTFGQGGKARFRDGLLFIALGICVATSEFNSKIPLLAPTLWFFGAGPFISGCLKLKEMNYSTIQRPNGSRVLWFNHKGCNKQDRERFEALFTQTVKSIEIPNTSLNPISGSSIKLPEKD